MIGSVHRRVGIATTAALIVGLMAVTPASARVAPSEPGSQCQSAQTGYIGVAGGGGASAWVWYGDLRFDMCVNRTSSGNHYGVVRLSAPSGPGLKDFTGVVRFYLRSCTSGYPTVATGIWEAPTNVRGALSSSRYWWNWQSTGLTSSSASSFYVLVAPYGAVSTVGWYESLTQGPYGAAGSPGYVASGCMAP